MKNNFISPDTLAQTSEWAIMHGVAFRQDDHRARHCPYSIAPMNMARARFEHLRNVAPILSRLITRVSEDHAFLQQALQAVAQADPFFARLLSLHRQVHGDQQQPTEAQRKALLIMRSDFMDDRQHGAKVIEFNGIAAGMAPFGQRATEFHDYLRQQWPALYQQWSENDQAIPAANEGLEQLAYAITHAAQKVRASFADSDEPPTFLMVVQEDEDNVYDQHLLEVALQQRGLRTVRRTFKQLSHQLSTGEGQRLLLADIGVIDVVYLRAGYQYEDYLAPELNEEICCHTLSQTRVFIEQHHVAVNATFSQQLATSKTMQLLLTLMPSEDYARWGITLEEANLVKSVLADMKPIDSANIAWFMALPNKQDWVLKNQGEGGGHCIFGDDIPAKLQQLDEQHYGAWALMQRLYPHERERPTIAVRDGQQQLVSNLVSEIGIFTVSYDGEPATEFEGYAGYLIRSKPASENEGGIHSGQGILDSLTLSE